MATIQRVTVVDSHTGNEPTRVVLAGGPNLGDSSVADRARRLAVDHERWYKLVIDEPRGFRSMSVRYSSHPAILAAPSASSTSKTSASSACAATAPSG